MKIKTSELSGVALDWAVAMAADEEIHHEYVDQEQRKMLVSKWQDYSRDGGFNQQEEWQPSTDWSQCGPLIERFSLEIVSTAYGGWHAVKDWYMGEQLAWFPKGETILISACRAIVAERLGYEVDVPEGLV